MSMASSNILSITQSMPATMVGWKFSRLKEMWDKKLPVPQFFCLTSYLYEQVVRDIREDVHARLAKIDFDNYESIVAGSTDIRTLFTELTLKKELEQEILSHFDKLFTKDTLVSVRSSTVGIRLEDSEDSAENPFAGMSDSFLYVKREQIIEKIRLCWASGFNAESILYRHKQNLNLSGFGVAVGVQEMVFGTRSFVAFTCNPNTASRDMVIMAGHGIGEGVVQEKVAVDHYFQNFQTQDIEYQIVEKIEMLSLNRLEGYGLYVEPVPEALQKKACLSDEEIRQVTATGRIIEKIFKGPQDIEGTFTQDGNLYILQARPVAIDYRRQRVWTNANVTESFPGVTTALTYSFARFFYRVIFYDCYRSLGISANCLRDNHEMLDKMIGFIKGRVYYNLTSFYNLHSQSPLFPLFSKPWEKMMGFASSYQTKPSQPIEKIVKQVGQAITVTIAVGKLVYLGIRHKGNIQVFHTWWEELIKPLRGRTFDKEDPIVLLAEFHRVWREVGTYWGVTLINDTFLPMVYGLVNYLFKKWKLSDSPALLSDLLCGDEQILSVDIVLSVVRLAEKVRDHSQLKQIFKERSPEELWLEVEAGKLDDAFCLSVKNHLHYYGDRGLQELKIEQPNLRQTPWVLLKMVQDYANLDVSVETLRTKENATRKSAEEQLNTILRRQPIKRLVLGILLNSLRQLIRNRENSRYCRSELYGFSKNILFGMGEYFARNGIIKSQKDIVHLTIDEIFGYIDGTGVTENLQALVELRQQEFAANALVETPEQITTLGPIRQNVLSQERFSKDQVSVLKGMGSSSGKVRGTAKVILDPTSPVELNDNMILVAKETDPGWLFLMLASKGIVVERGSMLSHTAITGRKFGIPTVVGVPNATTLINDNAQIEIDGATGIVTLI